MFSKKDKGKVSLTDICNYSVSVLELEGMFYLPQDHNRQLERIQFIQLLRFHLIERLRQKVPEIFELFIHGATNAG